MTDSILLTVEANAEVRVKVNETAPADVFTRAEAQEFQDSLYGSEVADRAGVLKHWAYNAIFNGVDDPCQLDGWGDLDRGMVELLVIQPDVQEVYEV